MNSTTNKELTMTTADATKCPIKVDMHEPSFPCAYWRACCCGRPSDGHCWGCGCEMSAHADGDHPRFADEVIADVGSGYDEGYSNGK